MAFAIGFAPAGILVRSLQDVNGVDLIDARGTVWRGKATLILGGTDQGDVSWRLRALPLFRLTPTYAWALTNTQAQLNGDAAYHGDGASLNLQGTIQADSFNPWLQQYDIQLSGQLDVAPTHFEVVNLSRPALVQADGQINWSGGMVRYKQSGQLFETQLPPLVAYIEQTAVGAQATVFVDAEQTPLIIAEQTRDGFVKVGMTKRFTKVLNNPWPGSDADHEIVLEFEEQIFPNQ